MKTGKTRKTGGGVGTNQYAVRGRAKALPMGTVDTSSVSTALVNGTDRRRCGEVWGTKCRAWVTPPEYTHGKHPVSGARERYTSRADADPRVLEELSADKDPLIRIGVARNPCTSPEVLDALAKDEDGLVRIGVAWNPNTSPEVLDDLAKDKDIWVRRGGAGDPNASPEVLDALAQAEGMYVRLGVAGNPSTSPTTLRGMIRDPNATVVETVLCNPNLPDEIKAIYTLRRISP